jgi:ATP-binding cassette, subfamily B, bacterial
VAELQASVSTVAHHERADYLDRLSVLRDQVFVLDHMYMSLFSTCGWVLRLGVTLVLLVSMHPAPAAAGVRPAHRAHLQLAPGVERQIEERGAAAKRLAGTCSRRHHRAAGQGGAGQPHRSRTGARAP